MVVFGSARAAPGVTTTAAAVAGCFARGLLVEADADGGGVIALRYQLGREPGLTTLAAAGSDAGSDDVLAHAQVLPGGVSVLVGPDSADRAGSLWRTAGERLATKLSVAAADVVVDAGRLSPTSPALCLLCRADLVVLVTRPRAEELVAVSHRLGTLRRLNPAVVLALVGDRPYSAAQVARDLGCEVVGVVADDPRAAHALAGSPVAVSLARSALARSAATLARAIADRLGTVHHEVQVFMDGGRVEAQP